MSLINEALKKAQRLRTEDQMDASPPVPGGGRIAKRGQARSANTMVLIGSGAVVLVVLSVVATVYWINRPAPSKPPPPPPKKVESPAAAGSTPTIVAPIIVPPSPTPVAGSPAIPTTGAVAPAAGPATAPLAPPPSPPGPANPVASAPAAATPAATAPTTLPRAEPVLALTPPPPAIVQPPPTPVAPKPDERVAAFVDAVRVTGIRSSGNESRVLMNDRVYRVNDIVERTLGVRLVKVETDSLTFADANGVTYVKHF